MSASYCAPRHRDEPTRADRSPGKLKRAHNSSERSFSDLWSEHSNPVNARLPSISGIAASRLQSARTPRCTSGCHRGIRRSTRFGGGSTGFRPSVFDRSCVTKLNRTRNSSQLVPAQCPWRGWQCRVWCFRRPADEPRLFHTRLVTTCSFTRDESVLRVPRHALDLGWISHSDADTAPFEWSPERRPGRTQTDEAGGRGRAASDKDEREQDMTPRRRRTRYVPVHAASTAGCSRFLFEPCTATKQRSTISLNALAIDWTAHLALHGAEGQRALAHNREAAAAIASARLLRSCNREVGRVTNRTANRQLQPIPTRTDRGPITTNSRPLHLRQREGIARTAATTLTAPRRKAVNPAASWEKSGGRQAQAKKRGSVHEHEGQRASARRGKQHQQTDWQRTWTLALIGSRRCKPADTASLLDSKADRKGRRQKRSE